MSNIRQDIAAAIAARLEQVISGYEWTLPGGRVHTCATTVTTAKTWPKTPFSLRQVPAVGIYDTDQESDPNGVLNAATYFLTVKLVGFVAGSDCGEAARDLLADLLAAVGSDETWGGLAMQTRLSTAELLIDDSGADVVAGCGLELRINYRTTFWSL